MAFAALAITACADSADLGNVNMPPGPPPDDRVPGVLAHIREDFINQELVADQSGVLIDVNQGLVTLPTEKLPVIRGDMVRSYATTVDENGMVAAAQIIIQEQAILRASDSIALVASDLLRVTGEIHAGKGGVMLAAGKQLIIDGTIESEGPIQLSIGDEDGVVQIRGRVMAVATADGVAPGVEILGRGSASIAGSVRTQAQGALTSGDIRADLYGTFTVASYGEVTTDATPEGAAGAIRLKSESAVEIEQGARVGAAGAGDPTFGVFAKAGDLELEAERIYVGTRALLAAGASTHGRGGAIALTAGDTVILDEGARVVGGDGVSGGTVLVEASTLGLGVGAGVVAGLGNDAAGSVRVEASSGVHLDTDAKISGGSAVCAEGGNTTLLVAGPLALATGAKIVGGAGDNRQGITNTCPAQLHKGGDVEVTAREIQGDAEGSIIAGMGSVRGARRVVVDPAYEVAAPNLSVATRGFIESKTIDRGEAARGRWPHLVSLQTTVPSGTRVQLQLGAVDDPSDPAVKRWVDVDGNLSALANERYFRYRVTLEGRAFDTPVLDYFDIELAPER